MTSVSQTPETLGYRPCVGITLISRTGLVFVGHRITSDEDIHWQMPQGGIDRGESPRDAAFRELAEETGTGKARVIGEMPEWLSYDLPAFSSAGPFAAIAANARNGSPCASRAKTPTLICRRSTPNSALGSGCRCRRHRSHRSLQARRLRARRPRICTLRRAGRVRTDGRAKFCRLAAWRILRRLGHGEDGQGVHGGRL